MSSDRVVEQVLFHGPIRADVHHSIGQNCANEGSDAQTAGRIRCLSLAMHKRLRADRKRRRDSVKPCDG